MGRFGLLLLLLAVISVNATRQIQQDQNARRRGLEQPEECAPIQSFERGRKYSYRYDAIVETGNSMEDNITNGMRLTCEEVLIRVPSNCSAVLTVDDCKVYESRRLPNGSLSHDVLSPTSYKMDKALKKHNLYFIFNQGEMKKISVDANERTDIANIKRGILSALQFKYSGRGVQQPLGVPVEQPEVNIFGVGNMTATVKSFQDGFARLVEVQRDPKSYVLPWNRQQWSSLHTVFDESEFTNFVSDLFVENSKNFTGKANQTCKVVLGRGRHVVGVDCVEHRDTILMNNTVFQVLMQQGAMGNLSSNVTIRVNLQERVDTTIDSEDRLSPIVMARYRRYHQDESLMFEEQWQETIDAGFFAFDPIHAMECLVTIPENKTTPGLFSKFARFIYMSNERSVGFIWKDITKRYTGAALEKATNIWVQLLYGCSSATYWCSLPVCQPIYACQVGMSTFIDTTSQQSWSPSVKKSVLGALSSIPYPNITIVTSALNIVRTNSTPEAVIMLGKVMARYAMNPNSDKQADAFGRAKQYVVNLLGRQCDVRSPDSDEKKVMIAAMKAIGVLGEDGAYAIERLVSCASNANIPKELPLNAVRAMKEIQLEAASAHRSSMLEILRNDLRPVNLRLACYLLLITKNATVAEVQTMLEIAATSNQPKALRFYIKEHIQSQLALRDTSFCELSQITIQSILHVIEHGQIPVEIDINQSDEALTEKYYETTKPLFIPVLNQELNCTFSANLVYSKNSMLPILANVTVSTKIITRNITLLESTIDLSKILAVLEPLFGDNGIYPDQGLEQLMKMPLSQLLRPNPRNEPLLQHNQLQKLFRIQDEGSLVYSMLMMKNKSPFELKLFGLPIKSDVIFSLPFMRNMNIMDVWKLVDKVEKGMNFSGVLADQPLLGHFSSPTSMGPPHVYHIESSYFQHMNCGIIAEVRKILLTGQGEISLKSMMRSKASLSWVQTVQLPSGVSAGCGYQISVGHNNSVNASIKATQNRVTVDIDPLPRLTEIASLKLDQLVVKQGENKLIEQSNVCPSTCIYGNCESGNSLYYKACIQPTIEYGLYLQSNAEKHYQVEAKWGRMDAQVNNVMVQSKAIDIQLKSKQIQQAEGEKVMQVVGRSIPSLNQVQLEVLLEDQQQPWIVAANSAVYREPTSQPLSPFEGMIASLNVTKPNGQVAYENIITLVRQHQENDESLYQEMMELLTGHNSMQSHPKYVVTAGMQLPVAGDFSASGVAYIKGDLGGYSAKMKVKKGSIGDRSARTVSLFNISSIPISQSTLQGFETVATFENLAVEGCPFSLFNISAKVLNDSQGRHVQEMGMNALKRDSQEPYFLYSLIHLNKSGPSDQQGRSGQASPFQMNSTFTANVAQLQFDVVAPNMKQLEVVQRLVIPKSSIKSSRMHRGCSHDVIRIKQNDRELRPSGYELLIATGTNDTEGYSLTANFTSIQGPLSPYEHAKKESYNVSLSLKPDECPLCHQFSVESSNVSISSKYENKTEYQGHSASIYLHESALQYLPISNKSKEAIKYLGKSKSSNKLKLGYKLKANQSKENSFYEVGYEAGDSKFNGLFNFTLPGFFYFGKEMNVRVATYCKECIPFYPTTFSTGFGVKYANRIPSDVYQFATDGYILELLFEFDEEYGPKTTVVGKYNLATKGDKLVDMKVNQRAFYTARNSIFKQFFPLDEYNYETGVNASLIHETTDPNQDEVYNVSMIMGIYPDSPRMVGNYSYREVDQSQNSEVCRSGSPCYTSKLKMLQATKCSNYTAFYTSRDQIVQYDAANCTVLYLNYTGYGNAWEYQLLVDGEKNADIPLNRISFNSTQNVENRLKTSLAMNLTRDVLFVPQIFNLTINATDSEYALDFYGFSDDVQLYYRYERGSSMFFNSTTVEGPYALNCTVHGDFSNSARATFEVPSCMVGHPVLTPKGPVDITGEGVYHSLLSHNIRSEVTRASQRLAEIAFIADQGYGQGHIQCEQGSQEVSPCNINVNYNNNNVRLDSRVNSSLLNHTANVSVTIMSPRQQQGIEALFYDIETNNTFSYMNTSFVYDLGVQYQPDQQWLLKSMVNVTKEFSTGIILRNGSLEYIHMLINTPFSPFVGDSLYSYFHYASNRDTDFDLYVDTQVGNKQNITIGFYQGMNKANANLHLDSAPEDGYLEAIYFNYTACQKIRAIKVKEVYNRRERSAHTKLTQMETVVVSNFRPFLCSNEWRMLLEQLFPTIAINHLCNSEMKLISEYDARKNNEMFLQLFKDSQPIAKATFTQERDVQKMAFICEKESNPSCNIIVSISRTELQLDSMMNNSIVNHTCYAHFVKSPSHEKSNLFGMDFNVQTNNTIMLRSHYFNYDAMTAYDHKQGLSLYWSLNSTKSLANILVIDHGKLQTLNMHGYEIPILDKPRSWNITYRSSETVDMEILASVYIDRESSLEAVYYEGKNKPDAYLHQPVSVEGTYLHGGVWNYTSCGREAVIIFKNLYRGKTGKLVRMESIANITMWPFVNKAGWTDVLYPSWSQSPLSLIHLGDLQMALLYDAIENNLAAAKVILSKTIELSTNYSFYNPRRSPSFNFTGQVELRTYTMSPFSSHVYMGYNLTRSSDGHLKLKMKALTEGYRVYFMNTSYLYEYMPYQFRKNEFGIDCDAISFYTLVKQGHLNRESEIAFRYPNSSKIEPSINFEMVINGDDYEIRNITWRSSFMLWHLKRVVITILKDESRRLNGINMHDLTLEATPKHVRNPVTTCIVGSARVQRNGVCEVDIHDTRNEKVRIQIQNQGGEDWSITSNGRIRLSVIEMDLTGSTQWTTERLQNNYNMSIMYLNSFSAKMRPLFQMLVEDDLKQIESGRYFGDINWALDIWSLWTPSFYWNPRLIVSIKQPTGTVGTAVNADMLFSRKYYVSTTFMYSKACQTRIAYYKSKTMCIPREASIHITTDLPFMNSTHTSNVRPGTWKLESEGSLLMKNVMTGLWKPVFNYTRLNTIQIEDSYLRFGSWNVTGYVLEPIVYRYESNFSSIPVSEGRSRKFDYAFVLGDYASVFVNISAPSSSGMRRLSFHALDIEMANAELQVSECGIPFILFPQTFCVPQSIHLTNINVDIPAIRFLQMVPIFRLLPDLHIFDIELKNSEMSMSTTRTRDIWTITTEGVFYGEQSDQPMELRSVMSGSSNTFDFELHFMNNQVCLTHLQWNTTRMSMTMDTQFKSSWMDEHIRLVCPDMFTVSDMLVMIKTKGNLAKYLPVDIHWEYGSNVTQNSWRFALHSLAIPAGNFGKANISMGIDSSLQNFSLGWELMSDKHPILNNMFQSKIKKHENSDEWKLNTALGNVFLWTNMSSSIGLSDFKVNNVTVGLPDNPKGITAVYQPGANDSFGQVKMFLQDSDRIGFICILANNGHNTLVLDCQKKEKRPESARFRSAPPAQVDVARAEMQLSLSTGVQALTNIVSFNFSKAVEEKWINETLSKTFGINDEELIGRLSKYLSNEVEKLSHKLRVASSLDMVQNMMKSVSGVVSSDQITGPVVEYFNEALQIVDLLSGNTMKMKVINGSNFVALRCNITCAKKEQIMMQLNITSLADGRPVTNFTLVTPYSTLFMLWDIGVALKPLKFGIKSQESQCAVSMNFTCNESSQQCIQTNLTACDGNRYRCQLNKPNSHDLRWDGSCSKVDQFSSPGREVSRFSFDKVTVLSSIKALAEVSLKSLSGDLEQYIHRKLNVVDEVFAQDLAKEISHAVEGIEDIYYLLVPGKSSSNALFKALAKEGLLVLSHHLERYVQQEVFNTDYQKLLKSGYDYISSVLDEQAIKVPMFTFDWKYAVSTIYMEVTSTSPRKISFMMDTRTKKSPSMKSQIGADFWFTENSPMMNLTVNNEFMWTWVEVNFREMKVVKTLIGMPDCDNYVTVRSASGPYSYDIHFSDVEYASYACQVRELNQTMLSVNCGVAQHGQAARGVCSFMMPKRSLRLPQLLGRLTLMVPEIYEAANNPQLFKNHLQRTFNFTDEYSLNIIAEFLSKRSRMFTKKFHIEVVNYYINQITSEVLSLYDEGIASKLLAKLLSYPRITGLARGHTTVSSAIADSVMDIYPKVASKLMSSYKSIQQTFDDVHKISSKFAPQQHDINLFAQSSLVRDLIRRSYFFAESLHKFEYIWQKSISHPDQAKAAWKNFILESNIIEYVLSFFTNNVGPSYQWFKSPSLSQVISYNGQYFELPVMDERSECTYVHATDPLHNLFNIMSKGQSIVFAFPDKTMEITPEKLAFVTTSIGPKRQVNLPYVSDNLICEALPSEIICKCMDYSATMVFNERQRVRTTVVIHDAKFMLGAVGMYSQYPAPTWVLPNGTKASNPAELMSAYELTGRQECIAVPQKNLQLAQKKYGPGYKMCKAAFSNPQVIDIVDSHEKLADKYIMACSKACSGRDMSETCRFIDAFVKAVRSHKFPAKELQQCLGCKDVPTPITKSEVYFLVSLSQNTSAMDPQRTIRKLITKTISRMRDLDLASSKVGLVTYGGQGELYNPKLTAVDGVTTAAEEDRIVDVIRYAEFNGAYYTPISTKQALEYVANNIRTAPKGIAKSLVIVAPEVVGYQKNIGFFDMEQLATDFKDDLTSVFMWSPMSEEQCRNQNVTVVYDTYGRCLSSSMETPRDAAEAVVDSVRPKMSSFVSCNCDVKNGYTGKKSSKCSVQGYPSDVNF